MQKSGSKTIGLMLVGTIIGIMAMVTFYIGYNMEQNLREKLKMDIQKVAEQNAEAVGRTLATHAKLLQNLSKRIALRPEEQRNEYVKELRTLVQLQGYKRMAYVKSDGSFLTTDNYKGNFGKKAFFQKSMRGEIVINEVRPDQLGKADRINVISVPVRNSYTDQIEGVLFATLISDVFDKFMSINSFNNQGNAYVMTVDGKIIVNSLVHPVENVFNFFENFKEENTAEALAAIQTSMSLGQTELTSIEQGESMYFYYMPIDNKFGATPLYYVLSVPKKIVAATYKELNTQLRGILFAALLAILAAAIIYLWYSNKHEAILKKTAYEDKLTSGHNMNYLRDNLVARNWNSGYLVSMDIADFNTVNHRVGMKKGDTILKGIYHLLEKEANTNTLIAHEGQDIFAICFLESSKEKVITALQRVTEGIQKLPRDVIQEDAMLLRPFFGIYCFDDLTTKDCYTPQKLNNTFQTVSLASSTIPNKPVSRDTLLERFDMALVLAVEAKRSLKQHSNLATTINYAFYDDTNRAAAKEKKELVDGIDEALANNRYILFYQPRFSTSTGKMVAAEALVRLIKENGDITDPIPPSKFISLFETNGLIARLDEYVFKTVCAQQKQWMDKGLSIVPVSINLSQASLLNMEIVERYAKYRDDAHIPPASVHLEITESATALNIDLKLLIEKFQSHGFEIFLDDFGTGYSSLSTLNTMPFDRVKLDKSLIDYIKTDKGLFLVDKIIEFSRKYNMKITAEGVEDAEQAAILKSKLHESDTLPRVDDIQGYYYAQPLPKGAFEKMLTFPPYMSKHI